jgi:sedoheptulokinase
MRQMKYIGLDVGTTSICGVVIDTATKEIVNQITIPNRTSVAANRPGDALQDPIAIVADVEKLLLTLIGSHQIQGIGITGQMHGILYIDSEGEPVSPLFTWQDAKGDLPVAGEDKTYGEVMANLTGYHAASGYGLVTHFYLCRHNEISKRAKKMCTIGDFVAMQLSSVKTPVIGATNAASLGCYDVSRKQFDHDALSRSQIDSEWLPIQVSSQSCLGTYRNIPLYTAIGDNQASFLGSISSPLDSLLVNVGTGGQISFYTTDPIPTEPWELRPFLDNGYLSVGATLSGGKSYELLQQFFRSVIEQFTETDVDSLYQRMEELVREGPPSDKPMIVVPQFSGSRQNPQARGSISNISMHNFTPQNLIYGFITGMVNELLSYLETVPTTQLARMRRVVGSGNGVRKNRLLQKVIEQQVNLPLVIPAFEEEAALGAALHAAVAGGAYLDYRDAARFVPETSR